MKTIGILGGMGPAATADLFAKLIRLQGAKTDQENVPVLIDSNTRIPDRTAAILAGGADPMPELAKSAKRLEQAGADCLIMPCNTAHYYYDQLAARVRIPFLHMLRETAKATAVSGCRRPALLATTGTIQSGVYEKAFQQEAPELSLLVPDEAGQAALMSVIYGGVKAGMATYDTAPLCAAMERLGARGADVFILGCTELPLAFERYHIPGKTLDPTETIARAALRFACGEGGAK